MITNGTKPAETLPRRQFHRHFGGTFDVPDFNLDRGLWMPDQNADGASTECTGYAVADLITDLTGIVRSPDFHYAATLFLEGIGPSTVGADFHIAMQAAVALGSLPKFAAGITAQKSGELFVSDWSNWTPAEKQTALQTVQNGTMNALGMGDAFDSIRSAAFTSKMGVLIGSPWYPEWNGVSQSGILPLPANPNVVAWNVPWHAWVIKGQKTINGVPYLIGKPWQGAGFGDRGFVYLDRQTVNAVLSVQGTGAIVFNPSALRWMSLIGIMVTRYPFLLSHITDLLKAAPVASPQAPNPAPTAPLVVQTTQPSPTPLPAAPVQDIEHSDTLYPDWSSQAHAFHNVRALCDLAGLSGTERDLICACIYQESRFEIGAINHNRNAQGEILSTDYSLCQVNDFYHIGPGKDFPSVQYVLDNPDKVVTWMIGMYKAGLLKQWVSYSSDAYRQWLLPTSPMWKL